MLLLGEQLIRDEVSAVFELIKNSYDADASHVTVTLENVSVKDGARITVLDNGHGMTREKLLSSWLEIGTLAKSEGGIRKSPKGRRYLGEKGIGRLAVHKLGWRTELTTRAEGSRSETDLAIDWTEFEKRRQDFLENLSVEWNEHSPKVFPGETKYEQGTRIIITKLQQRWTSRMIEKLSLNVESLTSPFVELRSFSVDLKVNDPVQPTPSKGKVQSALSTAPYVFDAEVDEFGRVKGLYQFKRPDLPKNLLRTWPIDYSILDPNEFPLDPQTGKQKPPVCGPFKFRLFAWDLTREDKEAIFGGARTYEDIIRPNAGVRVFRDGFRVLPYGNPDDDWLGLDSRRITGTFETKISRNQIIGIVDISSNENSLLRDKSDREGLIDNEAFKDFRSRILTAINLFETQRGHDRAVMKKQLGRTRKDKLAKIQATLSQIEEILVSSKGMSAGESLHQVQGLLAKLKTDVVEVVEESEEPLLVAAAMGIAYMIPTHEAVRDLQRIKRILQTTTSGMPDSKTKSELQKAWRFAFRADEIVSGTAKIFKRGKYKDIELDSIARQAYDLMRDRLEEDSVKTQVLTKRISIHGSEKFLLVVLLNLLDNADYWLATIDANKRRINIIVDKLADGLPVLIVSDSGPGLPDDIEYLAEPFVTNKPDGMGLGLYIANEIAIAHHGRLRSFSQGEVAGLLSGASVGIVFPERGVENGSN
ncbi:MAG TPA: ATP-binding protein [Nitrososphaerales archaeon]|nr:ATP-binding protein [Nitrososphaerales archaeon]